MIDDKTPNLVLPLPHPLNSLDVDVLRLRTALYAIDTKIATLDDLLASDDTDLDTVREIVEAVKSAQGDIAGLGDLVETIVGEHLSPMTAATLGLGRPDGATLEMVPGQPGVFRLVATALPNLLNSVNVWNKAQRGAVVALTYASNIALNLSLSNNFSLTLTGNATLSAPTNVVPGQSGILAVTQDATGSRTLAYNSVYKFSGGATKAPVLSSASGAVDYLTYYVETTSRIWLGLQPGVA
jgi:hypothetical protein